MNLKKYIYYSTLLSVFTEAMRYNLGFDLKLFYLIVFINLIVFILYNKIVYSKGLLIFHSIVIFTGLYSCLFGYNGFGYFIIQFLFLVLIPTYYLSFFTFFRDKFEEILFLYCKFCVILAIIGIVKLPYDLSQGEALHSIMLEPAHYCTVVFAGFFITFREQRFPRYYYKIILVSILLTGSSLGFIGLGLSIILYAKRISIMKIIYSTFLVLLLGGVMYFNFSPFRMRFDDTISSSQSGDLSKANLSTYALLSNFYVSSKSFASNPLIGNGIGSHLNSRALYLKDVEGVQVFEDMGMDHLNAQDAGSLFSRLMSELGLVGIIGVFYFIWKFYVSNNKKDELSYNTIVSRGIVLYFFAKLFREGHYFSPEMYFFVFLYVFNYYDWIKSKNLYFVDVK